MSEPPADLGLPGDSRALLEAVVAISSDLDLHSVLNRIVESACRITQARYGALGVLDTFGRSLSDFVTFGLTEEEHRAIGELPRGRGILGLLIRRPEAVRLEHLAEHPDSFGFPPHHPPMESFLGVPVRIRGTVFGNLYLTEKQGPGGFTEQDEVLVGVLATAAGFVIENARAYAQSERRRQWLEASVQITEALQPPIEMDEALRQITVGARRVVRACAVALLLRKDVEPEVVVADGAEVAQIPAVIADLAARIADAEQAQEVAVVPHAEHGTVVLVPLRAQIAPGGVLLVVLESGRPGPEVEEVELLASLADQASLALDRAEAIADREELALVADRDRIARDLHDLVIQRLFATGLQLQGARRTATSDELRERLDTAVLDLDTTIRDIRSTIFELQRVGERSLRADIRDLAKEYVPVLGFTPLVRTTGPVDTAVGGELGEQLLAVLREALSNTARHAEASAAVVEVQVNGDRVLLSVTDNGKGIPGERHESGLRNVRRRAADRGGTVRL
ncbi:GAF domain-containing sensor histidine kinase, partial [Nocardioides sp.]|uniref:GAF domain-containing sensor histidine kinase n=1 Tax=Nocardioides sp. TaxID=35761 RepID=UPI002D7EA3A4